MNYLQMSFIPLISKNSLNIMQILKDEQHDLFKKKIREKEALEQKLVSPDKFFNNSQNPTESTLIVCSVVFKFILGVMKVQDSL